MSFDEIKFWAGLAFQAMNALATAGVWLYVRYGDRNAQIDRKFEAIQGDFDRRMDEQDKTIARLSGLIEHAPTHDDLGRLYSRLNQLAESNSRMEGELKGINDNLRMLMNNIAAKGMQ